jgi:NADH:ubiquinone oxidoreductase subunit 3 (subunit A)
MWTVMISMMIICVMIVCVMIIGMMIMSRMIYRMRMRREGRMRWRTGRVRRDGWMRRLLCRYTESN